MNEFSLFWIAYGILVILVIALQCFCLARRNKQATLREFSIRHHLTFQPGSLLTLEARANGVYRGHNLEVELRRKGGVLYTYVIFNTKSTNCERDITVARRIASNPASQNVLELLVPNGLPDIGGEIEAANNGRQLSYKTREAVTEVKLGLVCNLLGDLGDNYSHLVAVGGQAVDGLQVIAREHGLLRNVAVQMLKDIAAATQGLGSEADQLLCPRCLVHPAALRADLPGQPDVTYYGCRACHQSQEFIERPQAVIAVLDTAWRDAQAQQDGLLRVNWLARNALFDFDQVEIVQATDKDVEHFAMEIGNDTDPIRKPRYAAMRCVVNPTCGLSENTLRVLASTFGQVQQIRA